MGDNAKKSWEWHNTVVGEGYQAKGVVRQRHSEEFSTKVIDLRPVATSLSIPQTTTTKTAENAEKEKGRKLSKNNRRKRSDSPSVERSPKMKRSKFNPLLQAFSLRLMDNLHQVKT